MSKNKIKADSVDTGLFGKYRKKETASTSAATPSTVVRQPTALRRAEFVSASSNKNACWSSFPNLPVTNSKTKLTPPQSPNKPRSKSVRMPKPPKKNITTRFHQFLGSHSNLGSSEKSAEVQSGVYRPLRPRSIGGSSDCSSNQSDLSRCDSLRDSSRSRVSHTNESVASSWGVTGGATPIVSYDSFDSPSDATPSPGQQPNPAGTQEFSNLRPISIALPHSTSTVSLTSVVRAANSKVDLRYHSYAAPGGNDGTEKRDRSRMRTHRSQPLVPLDIVTSIMDEFQCGSKTSQSVLPSDPEYSTVAQVLMTASPTRKSSVVMTPEGKEEGEPPHGTKELGAVESLHPASTRTARSLPTTPLGQTFTFVRQEEISSSLPDSEDKMPQDVVPPCSGSTHASSSDLLHTPQQGKTTHVTEFNLQGAQGRLQPDQHDSQDLDLPPGWEVVNSTLYGTYFVNHNNRTAQYQPPYQHPHYSRPPSANHRSPRGDEEDLAREGARKMPLRSYSHRGQDHVTSMASLPRRTKSFRDQEEESGGGDLVDITHERQISTTMTYVPPSPYQIKEIPSWLREYIEAPFGTKEDKRPQWEAFSQDDLNGLDTMIKRLLKKGLEQIVKKYEYYRVTVQQEREERSSHKRAVMGEETLSLRSGIMDYGRASQRRAIMDDDRFSRQSAVMDDDDDDDDDRSSQRRTIVDKERLSWRKGILDCERASERRLFHSDSLSSSRRTVVDDDRSIQRKAIVEPADEMNYQPHTLPAPYNQPFPQFQHQLLHPQGHEYMQATHPSYLLEQYHSNPRPGPYYHPSCLPPGYPNFCMVNPETTMSKEVGVPTLCLEETYV